MSETRIRRLSRVEYDNTLRDLGVLAAGTGLAVKSFAADSVIGGAKRGFLVGGSIDSALARDFVDAATNLAATATGDLPKLTGCTPRNAGEEDACARTFISSFGRRAFRRPLATAEVDELFRAFGTARTELDYRSGIEVALASILAAPELIYLVEAHAAGSAAGSIVPVDGFGMASRLSYFLWDSTPDAQLLSAAETGGLSSEAQVESQVQRMLADPRARAAVNRFLHEWTFIEELSTAVKDPARFDWYTPGVAADLQASFIASLEGAFWGSDPTLGAFVGGKTMFVNAALAKAYGFPAITGTALVETALDPGQRRGLLTHPAFLALAAKSAKTDPIHRGLFVRQQFLCTHLPEPPDTDENGNPIDFNIPPPAPGVSNRERFKKHTEKALCSGCHNLIDPIGFGFESYDAVGRFRAVDEDGNPVDATGSVNDGGDLTGAFDGALGLVDRITKSETVAECMTLQWFRFALGREETSQDACSNAKVTQRFVKSGGNLKELMVALAVSDAFRYRKVGGAP